MSSKKISSYGDFDKVVLTETVPYEVPILFSNFGFYRFLRDGGLRELPFPLNDFYLRICGKNRDYTVPFDYKIKKDSSDFRRLSLIHPFSQISFVEFYKNYKEIMVDRCGLSDVSLRHPSGVAKYYCERDFSLSIFERDTHAVDSDPGIEGSQSKIASSFFYYKRFNFIYKFYESSEFHVLEKKHKKLMRFDISKCFHHIYTHSLTWAVKSKAHAKQQIKEGAFENAFDTLMQKANYNETNGIVVGPEASRIFAEIILQRIDLNVRADLEGEGIVHGRSYSVRRYIDDYFVFYDNDVDAEKLLARYRDRLSEYKLFLNDKKTKYFSRPFITKESVTKVQIRKLLDGVFISLINKDHLNSAISGEVVGDELPINRIWNVRLASNAFIRDIKSVVSANNSDFECMANYSITAIIRNVRKIALAIRRGKVDIDPGLVRDLLIVLVDIVFFVFSMSPRVRTSYLVGQFCLLVTNLVATMKKDVKETLRSVLVDELCQCLDNLSSESDGSTSEIEKINLLIILKEIARERAPNVETVMRWFGVSGSSNGNYSAGRGGLDYFCIVSLLYYFGGDVSFSKERDFLIDYAGVRLAEQDSFTKAEYAHLFFDLMACPFIDEAKKKFLIRAMLGGNCAVSGADVGPKVKKILDCCSGRTWFFNWEPLLEQAGLEKALRKKELRTAY